MCFVFHFIYFPQGFAQWSHCTGETDAALPGKTVVSSALWCWGTFVLINGLIRFHSPACSGQLKAPPRSATSSRGHKPSVPPLVWSPAPSEERPTNESSRAAAVNHHVSRALGAFRGRTVVTSRWTEDQRHSSSMAVSADNINIYKEIHS